MSGRYDNIPTSSPDYDPEHRQQEVVIAPPLRAEGEAERPIDWLAPHSELHAAVLNKLTSRLKMSEDRMSSFHSRWQVNERRFMAYIANHDFEAMLEASNKKGEVPSAVAITVPYAYATVWTIVTYLVHTFCGRKPIFQVGSYAKEAVEPARKMETVLQFNADKTKLVRRIFQWMMDGQIYGLGIVRTLWTVEMRKKTQTVQGAPLGPAAPDLLASTMLRQQTSIPTYEGNEVTSINPYLFFPDPRVPMEECNTRGEFVFWRSYEGLHTLKKAESSGLLSWIAAIGKGGPNNKGESSDSSSRDILTGGSAEPGADRHGNYTDNFHQLDQGTVELVPAEWGLGDSTDVEKWLFTIANKRQIIQAEPFDADHGKHPVSVIEPNSIGYGFGQLGIVDMLGPIQDVLSWFVNSHMHNVRSVLNNMLVVDPNFVEMQDLKTPGPGKIIRLKPSAMGRDVRTVLHQLNIQDVTGNHMGDMQQFMRIGDIMSAVNDNLRGVQEQGGRRSATEARISGESGASRLASLARMISAQGMTDLAEQMSLNIQQYQSMEFYLQIVGAEGLLTPINPDDVQGNFYFPVHDGTLPLDRIALLDVWKEVWMAVSTNPQLAMQYNGPAIFEHIADLGGAKNLSQFRVQVAAPGQEMPNGGMPIGGLPGVNPGGGQAALPGGFGAPA